MYILHWIMMEYILSFINNIAVLNIKVDTLIALNTRCMWFYKYNYITHITSLTWSYSVTEKIVFINVQ